MFAKLLPIWIAYFFAAAAPGPSQIFLIENASFGSKSFARWAALGITVASGVWVAIVTLGLGAITQALKSKSTLLIGASLVLLTYFFLRSLQLAFRSRKNRHMPQVRAVSHSPRKALAQGFLINLINPNSLTFYLGLFAPLLTLADGTQEIVVCGAGIVFLSFCIYQGIVGISGHRRLQAILVKSEVIGRLLIAAIYGFFIVKLVQRL